MTKTTKSILKRMKITKNGKIITLGSGINHFQAKKRRRKQLSKKRYKPIPQANKDAIKNYLYH